MACIMMTKPTAVEAGGASSPSRRCVDVAFDAGGLMMMRVAW